MVKIFILNTVYLSKKITCPNLIQFVLTQPIRHWVSSFLCHFCFFPALHCTASAVVAVCAARKNNIALSDALSVATSVASTVNDLLVICLYMYVCIYACLCTYMSALLAHSGLIKPKINNIFVGTRQLC